MGNQANGLVQSLERTPERRSEGNSSQPPIKPKFLCAQMAASQQADISSPIPLSMLTDKSRSDASAVVQDGKRRIKVDGMPLRAGTIKKFPVLANGQIISKAANLLKNSSLDS